MYTLFLILIGLACLLLILVVLMQNSKGGGLASNFAGSNQIMGVRKTTDFIEKFTWYLAVFVVVFSLIATTNRPSSMTSNNNNIDTELTKKVKENQTQSIPMPAATAPTTEDQPNNTPDQE